jgi:hypothetical protein
MAVSATGTPSETSISEMSKDDSSSKIKVSDQESITQGITLFIEAYVALH